MPVQLADVWCQHFRDWAPHPLPLNYVTLDTETVGCGSDQLITEVGYAIVKDGQVSDRGTWVLNWLDSSVQAWVEPDWVEEACSQMAQIMRKPLNVDPDRMRAEGKPPRKVLEQTLQLLQDTARHRLPLVGNNVEHFDVRVLNRNFEEWLDGATFDKKSVTLLDAGLLFKALRIRPAILPRYSDTLPKYLQKMRKSNHDQKYGLEYCLTETGLIAQLDKRQLHGAEYDAHCSHLLFEVLRKELQ